MNFNAKFSARFSLPVRNVVDVLCENVTFVAYHRQDFGICKRLVICFIALPKVDLFHNEILFTTIWLICGSN